MTETEKTDYNGMSFAFGPKILLDPTFAITFQELKGRFVGQNRISKNSTMVLKGSDLFFQNLDCNATLICGGGMKYPKEDITFVQAQADDHEVFRIRGYKPTSQN